MAKPMFYWLKVSILCAMLGYILGCNIGCNHDPSRTSSVAQLQPEPTETLAPKISIVDRLQRRIQFDKTPERIVSLSPATTELIFAIGAGRMLVGVTEYCDYPEEAQCIPRVGSGPMGTLSIEAIVRQQPDLILCKFDTHQPLVPALERLGLKVLALGPESLLELQEEAEWLGQLLDHQAGATELVQSMNAHLEHLSTQVPQPERPLRAFYHLWHEPLMSAGTGTYLNELMKLAGVENIVDVTLGKYPRISPELILRADPELIFLPSSPSTELDLEKIMTQAGWENVTAVRKRRIHVIDGDCASRCGPRMLRALEQMIQAAHQPEATGL